MDLAPFHEAARNQLPVDVSGTMTIGSGLAFRTLSGIAPQSNALMFHVANYNPDNGTYEHRRVFHPLTTEDIDIIKAHGYEDLPRSALKPAAPDARTEIDSRFIYPNPKPEQLVGFRQMLQDVLAADDNLRTVSYFDVNERIFPLPESLRAKEREVLGTFYVRDYIIAEGLIASLPRNIEVTSRIYDIQQLMRNGFDPRPETELDPQEWEYARQYMLGQEKPKPVYVQKPYEKAPLGGREAMPDRRPVHPGLANKNQLAVTFANKKSSDQKQLAVNAPDVPFVRPTLNRRDREDYVLALLEMDGPVSLAAPKWLNFLDKHCDGLKLSDLADENGPLGTLFYYCHDEETTRGLNKDTRKWAMEALPVLLDYFEQKQAHIPLEYFTATKLGRINLLEGLVALSKGLGISRPLEAISGPRFWESATLTGNRLLLPQALNERVLNYG